MRTSLVLYVTGRGARTERALADLERLTRSLGADCDTIVVDLLEHPDAAEREGVITTPTLVKIAPPPQARALGDLSDTERVLETLGLARRP